MPNAEKVVLIGAGIAHSRSPRLHNHLFALYGLPLHYSLNSTKWRRRLPR